MCENTQIILVRCGSVGRYQRIIDRSNSTPANGSMPNRRKYSRPYASPNVKHQFKLLSIFLTSMLPAARNAKYFATEIHAQALYTCQRNPQKRLDRPTQRLSLLHRHKLLEWVYYKDTNCFNLFKAVHWFNEKSSIIWNVQFPLLGLDICFEKYKYHDCLRARVREGIGRVLESVEIPRLQCHVITIMSVGREGLFRVLIFTKI